MFPGTLPQAAQKSLAVLGKSHILPPETYLAGGSGLALHIGHRISVDFDFFTPASFNQETLAARLANTGHFTVSTISNDTLLGTFEGTKFSMFRYPYPLLYKTHDCLGVRVADMRDIAAMKIAAVMDRGTKKDFIDLYFLEKAGISLNDSLRYYDKKYTALRSNLYGIVKSLAYFVDAEESQMPNMIKSTSWDEIKIFFTKEAMRLTNTFLK